MNEKIEVLLKELKEKEDYQKVEKIISFLREERIKIIGNDLKKFLGRPFDEIQKEKILASVKELNNIAAKNSIDFYISEDFEKIEKILRATILDDLKNEFENQK